MSYCLYTRTPDVRQFRISVYINTRRFSLLDLHTVLDLNPTRLLSQLRGRPEPPESRREVSDPELGLKSLPLPRNAYLVPTHWRTSSSKASRHPPTHPAAHLSAADLLTHLNRASTATVRRVGQRSSLEQCPYLVSPAPRGGGGQQVSRGLHAAPQSSPLAPSLPPACVERGGPPRLLLSSPPPPLSSYGAGGSGPQTRPLDSSRGVFPPGERPPRALPGGALCS